MRTGPPPLALPSSNPSSPRPYPAAPRPDPPCAIRSPVVELNAVEARVIGSLAEKELTTPQQYPLTRNALVIACNQTSNRDPVVAYDDGVVEAALAALKDAGLLRFVHPGAGRSATRYRHVLDERFSLDARGLRPGRPPTPGPADGR